MTQNGHPFPRWHDLASTVPNGEKPPPAGNALEDMRTSVRAFHSRSGNQVLYGARKKNLTRVSMSGHASTDMHGDARYVLAFDDALTRVNAAADGQSQAANHLPDRASAFDRASRAVKDGKDTIARGVHYSAAESRDFPTNLLLISVD